MELDYLAQKLFNKNSFGELNAVELDQLVNMYPYSSLLHFFYTRKLKDKNAFGYPDAVAKSALYFNNPHWLNHQLNDRSEEKAARPKWEIKPRVITPEPAYSEATIDNRYEEAEIKHEEDFGGENSLNNGIQDMPTVTEAEPETVSFYQPEETKTDEPVVDSIEPTLVEIEESTPATAEITEPEDIQVPIEEIKHAEEMVVPPEDEIKIVHSGNEFSHPGNDVPVQTEQTMQVPENENQNVLPEPVAENPSVQAPEMKAEVSLIPIEPLYTIDYFASQGIKLTAEEETKDDLGKKLKSFTEWLKSMKKLHPERLAARLDEATEKNIQSSAEHSNEESDVNTEAMAEVLFKQGRLDKALEVYEKLSLLNPAKSAYFAAKIQEIKAH